MADLYYPPTQNGLQKTLAASLDEAATTTTLNNATAVQNKNGVFVVDRIDTDGNEKAVAGREFISFTGTSGAQLTGLTRGLAGSTDQDHATGAVVEFIPDVVWAQEINDVITAEHASTGLHGVVTATSIDLGSSTVVSGTLDEDDLTSNSATDLVTQQSVKAYVDSGWLPTGESWTFSAWDDTNGVSTGDITVPTDATTKYQPGMRVQFTQSTGGTKYGIITKVAATNLTIFVNTDYTLENEAITSPNYSFYKTPFGFDGDLLKWQVLVTSTANDSQSTPTQSTWYNLGSNSIDIPVGSWGVSYSASLSLADATSTLWIVESTLSTANNTASDADFTLRGRSGNVTSLVVPVYRKKTLTLSTKDTYYLNARTTSSGLDTLRFRGDAGTTIILASCAYL